MNTLVEQFVAHPAHAVLITGPSEAAATEALQAAQALLADHPEHLKTIAPAKDGTKLSIGIEQVRDLNSFFRLKVPGRAAIKRAVVITEADKLTREAQNALLKVLEEPPADTVILLTANDPEQLLATIQSRVQTIRLPHASTKPETEALTLVKQVLGGTTYDRLLLVDSLSKQKDTTNNFVTTLATVASASLQAAASKGNALERWQGILQAAFAAQESLSRSANAKLVLTELMLSM